MSRDIIVFDMDGVLVDVSESYRETIRETVKHFTGQEISKELIQDYKNSGGWNNDWALSQKIINDLGMEIEYQTVVDYFQSIFFGGNGMDGLMLREKWIAEEGFLERLNERFHFAIFTGRLREEANMTLRRFAENLTFDMIVGDDDVANPKPAPDGLRLIAAKFPGQKIWYIGDTVDDARSAKSAQVPFIGIAESKNPRYADVVKLLKPEYRQQYLQAHRNVPEKVLARYRELGMSHCSVYLLGDDLVMITEAEDHTALDAVLANDPADQEWQNFVRPMKADGDWQPMVQVFHIDLATLI
jgi:HAD superfamily hydrolase (TIGR01548 family)